MDAIADNIVIEMGKTKADALGDVLRGLRKELFNDQRWLNMLALLHLIKWEILWNLSQRTWTLIL